MLLLQFQMLYVTRSGKRDHFPKNKFSKKIQKCKFGPKILIFSFYWILAEKRLKFHIPHIMKGSQYGRNPSVRRVT